MSVTANTPTVISIKRGERERERERDSYSIEAQ